MQAELVWDGSKVAARPRGGQKRQDDEKEGAG